jgi:transposase InsO family protein
MPAQNERISLPKSWPIHVRTAILHVISLAQFATAHTRSWAANSINSRIRLQAELDRALEELSRRCEELRIKDARMAVISPHRRPHYPPTERLAILELKAARGWSLEQTARAFQVTAQTIASWLGRLDEQGPEALIRMRTPVNRFPDFVRYIVQLLKTLCPTMGKVKIAQTLTRAGLHLCAATVGRMLKEEPQPKPRPVRDASTSGRRIVAKGSNHTWHMDLTVVPTALGFWVPWLPNSLTQHFPFCWWVGVVVDHYSRRIMGISVFANRPTQRQFCAFLGRTVSRTGKPKYIICDRDGIFDCNAFRRWAKRKGIKPPRYGKAGEHGSIAVVERVILSLKTECIRHILVPLRRGKFLRELVCYQDWYNEQRAHTTLGGKTPNEVYFKWRPANRRPRIEPRRNWPRGSPCAKPRTLVAGKPGDECTLRVDFQRGRRHLPIVTLKRAA